jgi:cation diffusion facilitator CzcD-associated flavoprotein CzcO
MTSVGNAVKVVVVGAGFGGLCMAVRLKQAGISFVVLEKADEVGGIWRDNTYPGCGCDVPSHLYSFSFERYRSSTRRYPRQDEILDYLVGVADKYDLRPHLRTGSGVASADYDEATRTWTVVTEGGEAYTANAVVSAVGQLHRPRLPDIPGRDEFAGPAFHTARWDGGVDLTGRRVAVVGTGSSAAQLLPHVARQASHVDVYQRTPNWVIPKPRQDFGPVTRWAFAKLPILQGAYRLATYLAADMALSPVIRQGWSKRPAEVIARRHLRRQVPDPALRAKLTPSYPIGCKRIVIDSSYLPVFTRDDVDLVTEPIAKVTTGGIATEDGAHRDADVIVYATGFRTTEFLVPMTVTGRDGTDLHTVWQDGAEAYLGIALPQFPNLFLLHGPNTILGHNSNVFMIECQARFVMDLLRQLPRAVEVRPEAMHRYGAWLEEQIAATVWPLGCSSWYKTDAGRVTNPWPASTMRYRRLLRRPQTAAFDVT